MNHEAFEGIINNIIRRKFADLLNDPEILKQLSQATLAQRQKIFFSIAENHTQKEASEIYQLLQDKVCKNFLELPPYLDAQNQNSGVAEKVLIPTALHLAAKKNCAAHIINTLLEHKADIDRLEYSCISYDTPLDVAILHEKEQAFQALVKAGAKIFTEQDTLAKPQNTPLSHFHVYTPPSRESHAYQDARSARLRMLRVLIDNKADVNKTDTSRSAPIPIYFRALGYGGTLENHYYPWHFDTDFANCFITSPTLDLTLQKKCNNSNEPPMTALDLVTSYEGRNMQPKAEKEFSEPKILLQNCIINRFAKRFVEIEKELTSIECRQLTNFNPNLSAICSEYACADTNFERYGTTKTSLLFLNNILYSKQFKYRVDELRKDNANPKSSGKKY